MKKILLVAIFFNFIFTQAHECADDTSLDQINAFAISIRQPIQLNKKNFFDDSETSPVYSAYGILFSKGVLINSEFISFKSVNRWQRAVTLHLADLNQNRKGSAELHQFVCILRKVTKNPDVFMSANNTNCPVMAMTIERAGYDLRSRSVTLGSLKFNLGPNFIVMSECGK